MICFFRFRFASDVYFAIFISLYMPDDERDTPLLLYFTYFTCYYGY